MRLTSLEKDLSGLASSLETSFRTSQRRIPTSGLVSSLENEGSSSYKFVPDWCFEVSGLVF